MCALYYMFLAFFYKAVCSNQIPPKFQVTLIALDGFMLLPNALRQTL